MSKRDAEIIFDASRGVYVLSEKPFKYRWVLDRLALAFGYKTVRMDIGADFGRTRMVGVLFESVGGYGFKLPLCEVWPSDPDDESSSWDSYDINDNPIDVEAFIVRIRKWQADQMRMRPKPQELSDD